MEYFYVNTWGDAYEASSIFYQCDDYVRKVFYQEELGRMYYENGIFSS